MAHAQAYYCHASFGSQIDLYYPTIEHTPGFVFRTRATDSSSTKSTWQDLRTRMQKLTEDTLGDMDLRVYVGVDEDTNDRQSGLASVGVVCDRSQYNSQKWSINEYDKRVSSFGSVSNSTTLTLHQNFRILLVRDETMKLWNRNLVLI